MEKRLRQGRSLCERSRSERHLLRLSLNRRGFAHLLFLDAVELADGIRLDLPSLEWQGDLALAFAELLLEGAADERACEVDVSPLRSLDRRIRRGRSKRRHGVTPGVFPRGIEWGETEDAMKKIIWGFMAVGAAALLVYAFSELQEN